MRSSSSRPGHAPAPAAATPAPAPAGRARRPWLLGSALVLGLLAGACGSAPAGARGTAPFATLVVESHTPSSVNLYAVRGGSRHRVGMVNGVGSFEFDITTFMIGADRQLYLVAEPIGSSRSFAAQPIFVDEGDVIQLDLGSLIR